MATLSPASKKAIANLRAFKTATTNYHKCPLTRRAAVLILLFADRRGDLRVVLTMRSSDLKSYSGQAALPGGKADALSETPFMTARREAFEEIGLPLSEDKLPAGYTVEHLTELPCNLAATELCVRPCVAFLKTPAASPRNQNPDPTRDLLPKLDAKEVAAVFTAPFGNFLKETDDDESIRNSVKGEWYKGSWRNWHEKPWRMHEFFVPVKKEQVFLAHQPQSPADDDALQQPRYRVFGMTARILVDCARVAYGMEPTFEHNSYFGDEDTIDRLLKIGRLGPIRKKGDLLTREVIMEAEKVKL